MVFTTFKLTNPIAAEHRWRAGRAIQGAIACVFSALKIAKAVAANAASRTVEGAALGGFAAGGITKKVAACAGIERAIKRTGVVVFPAGGIAQKITANAGIGWAIKRTGARVFSAGRIAEGIAALTSWASARASSATLTRGSRIDGGAAAPNEAQPRKYRYKKANR